MYVIISRVCSRGLISSPLHKRRVVVAADARALSINPRCRAQIPPINCECLSVLRDVRGCVVQKPSHNYNIFSIDDGDDMIPMPLPGGGGGAAVVTWLLCTVCLCSSCEQIKPCWWRWPLYITLATAAVVKVIVFIFIKLNCSEQR